MKRNPAVADGRTDRVGGTLREDDRIGAPQLPEIVQIGAANKGLAAVGRPSRGASVEVQPTRPEVAPLDCVKKIGVPVQVRTKGLVGGKKWMRRNNKTMDLGSSSSQIIERADLISPLPEVDQQDVPVFYRALDARQQRNAAFPGVVHRAGIRQFPIVKSDRQRVEPTFRRGIDHLTGIVRDDVSRIVGGVEVKVYFQHVSS